MKIVVADSTPLIALSRIGRIDILPALVGRVVIPRAVFEEVILSGASHPGTALIREADWVEVAPDPVVADLDMPAHLGRGECSAIALAHARSHPLLTDDRDARTFARRIGVPVLRTLSLISHAERLGIVDDASALVDALVASGFRVHPAVLAEFRTSLHRARPEDPSEHLAA